MCVYVCKLKHVPQCQLVCMSMCTGAYTSKRNMLGIVHKYCPPYSLGQGLLLNPEFTKLVGRRTWGPASLCPSWTGIIDTLLCTTFYTSARDWTKFSWLQGVHFTNWAIFPSLDFPTATYWQTLKLFSPSSYFPHPLSFSLSFFFCLFLSSFKSW